MKKLGLWTFGILMSSLLFIGTAFAGSQPYVILDIQGMTCASCEKGITGMVTRLDAVDGVESISHEAGRACLKMEGEWDGDAVKKVVEEMGYTVTRVQGVERCEDAPKAAAWAPWAKPGALDVKVVSRGEIVDLTAHRVAEHYTIFDFAAPWCAPCKIAEETLSLYLLAHDDVAVRAVILEGADFNVSTDQPIFMAELKDATGIPYFKVVSPKGEMIFQGVDVKAALKAIEADR